MVYDNRTAVLVCIFIGVSYMNKEQALRIVKLLSALEAAGLMAEKNLPDYLYEEISVIVDELSKEILKS